MMKNVNKKTTVQLKKGETATLKASFIGKYNWKHTDQNTRSVEIVPTKSKSTYVVQDEFGCVKDMFEVVVTK
jgi:hypothetical protein